MDDYLYQLSQRLGEQLLQHNWRIATAESCTGGGVAAAITAIAGSSNWFEYGVVSYANIAKQTLLGVNPDTLDREGAVSEAVVSEMARGAIALSGANIAVAISGIAGPGGATPYDDDLCGYSFHSCPSHLFQMTPVWRLSGRKCLIWAKLMFANAHKW